MELLQVYWDISGIEEKEELNVIAKETFKAVEEMK
jgi:hypothetical protein